MMSVQLFSNHKARGTRSVKHMWLTGLALWMLGGNAAAESSTLYRYKDESGHTVLSYSIPAERVRFGYDLVDKSGRLIQRIAPQLSADAYQAKIARDLATQACEKMSDRVRKLYQGLEDIETAEQKALESIDKAINNLRANLSIAASQRLSYEREAAQKDLAGRRIPNALLDSISRAKVQEQTFASEIEKRFADKLTSRETYAYERQVFRLENCLNGLPPGNAETSKDGMVKLGAATRVE